LLERATEGPGEADVESEEGITNIDSASPGGIVWLTGLSGAGKSSLCREVETRLARQGTRCFVLDGDRLRQGLCSDLGYSAADREENMRRAAEVAAMLAEAGQLVLVAMISPGREARRRVRERLAPFRFAEAYVKCSLETCEERDPKGLYRQARAGRIRDFTGIDSLYEPPEEAELTVDAERYRVDACADLVIGYLMENFALGAERGETR